MSTHPRSEGATLVQKVDGWDFRQSRDRDIETRCTFKKQHCQDAQEGMDLVIHQQLSNFLSEYDFRGKSTGKFISTNIY